MNIGLWGARGDRRGLSIQTLELARHLPVVKIVGFDMDDLSPYPNDWSLFDVEKLRVFRMYELNDAEIRGFLRGLDVIVMAETAYDYRVVEYARDAGVKTAIAVNYEFYRFDTDPTLPRPDLLIPPSTWHLNDMPGAVFLPHPVARDRCKFVRRAQARTFLHVAGHRTRMDRNGTQIVIDAARLVKSPVKIVILSQSPLGTDPYAAQTAKLDIICGDSPYYWELYEEGDVLLMPRRFGGQSLPLAEAHSCGLPVIMSDVPPQNEMLHPRELVPAQLMMSVRVQPGSIDLFEVSPHDLAAKIDELYEDDEQVQELSDYANAWADLNSWETLLPTWMQTLKDLVDR